MKARIGWVLVVVLAATAGVWAGRATFSPPTAAVTASSEPLYTVAQETVGRSLTFPVTATWSRTPLGAGAAPGTVTSIETAPGSTVQAGHVLYTVDLRPVVVMSGAVPAFRELSAGTAGADVRQLQEFLRDEGYLEVARPDGTFGSVTASAVRAWQKAAGFLPVDGVVRAGDVVFTSTLPARVVLDPAVQVGAVVPTGQAVASALSPAPTFEIQLGIEQSPLVPTSGPAQVLSGERTWDAVIASATTTDDGLLVLELTAPDGGGCAVRTATTCRSRARRRCSPGRSSPWRTPPAPRFRRPRSRPERTGLRSW